MREGLRVKLGQKAKISPSKFQKKGRSNPRFFPTFAENIEIYKKKSNHRTSGRFKGENYER
ncbi:MAG: hypothetical protein ACI9XO_004949 [Paraglaciecola sp.]|jgi:hypothetical protein